MFKNRRFEPFLDLNIWLAKKFVLDNRNSYIYCRACNKIAWSEYSDCQISYVIIPHSLDPPSHCLHTFLTASKITS